MKRQRHLVLATLLILLSITSFADTTLPPGTCTFEVPQGWLTVDKKELPPEIEMMVRAPKANTLAPSLNLSREKVEIPLMRYLQAVKSIHKQRDKHSHWKDLGSIETKAGKTRLTLIDTRSKWGPTKIMQAITLRNGTAYLLTASALSNEFPQYYKDFFRAIRSIEITKDVFEMVQNPQDRYKVSRLCKRLQKAWGKQYAVSKKQNQKVKTTDLEKIIFQSPDFQTQHWQPFLETIKGDYADMGEEWKEQLMTKVEEEYLQLP